MTKNLRTWGGFFAALILALFCSSPVHAENSSSLLWGIMDWKNDSSYPDTDTSSTRPIFQDGDAHIIAHQYQNPSWLAYKISTANKNEITRIYNAGHCINLMLYFVSCTHNTSNNTFSYPLNDQFLTDFGQLVDAYKVGGGPLYIQVFPEFELWYSGKSSTEQDQYRAKIREQFAAMQQIVRAKYNKAYIGLCFFSRDFIGDTSTFVSRWDPVISISDVVFINTMSNYRQWDTHAQEIIKSTQFISTNWFLPIMFPFVDLWDDSNTPIFTDGDGNSYSDDAAFFSNCVTNWIGRVFTAPSETTSGATTNWATNLKTLRSRGVFAFSLYSANYCNKPTTPADPFGYTHNLQSYPVLTNVMSAKSRSSLYPVSEMNSGSRPLIRPLPRQLTAW